MIKVIKAAAAVFAALPGVAALLAGLGSPPDMAIVFGSMSTIAGVITVLVLYVRRHRISRLSQVKLRNVAIATFCALVLVVLAYMAIFEPCCVMGTRDENIQYGRVFFPLWTTGDLNQRIDAVGGRKAFVDRYLAKSAVQQLDKMPGIALARLTTTTILLILFCLIPILATCSFGVLALYLQARGTHLEDGKASPNGGGTRTART
jgi:hypothetical protein